MEEKRKYRLSLCYMIFAEMEVEAANASQAEAIGYQQPKGARRKFRAGPVVHRVEHLVPTGKPGEFKWEEVKRAS